MRIFLLTAGIVMIVACVLSVLFAALNMHAYHNMLDGSPEHYAALRRRAVVFFAIGAVLALAGAACLIIRTGF